jgi:hypothetical protein
MGLGAMGLGAMGFGAMGFGVIVGSFKSGGQFKFVGFLKSVRSPKSVEQGSLNRVGHATHWGTQL